jgi:pimeloyl-ACP methyl ester carboxylesterase
VNEPSALTRWLSALGRVAATSWPMAPHSVSALLAERRHAVDRSRTRRSSLLAAFPLAVVATAVPAVATATTDPVSSTVPESTTAATVASSVADGAIEGSFDVGGRSLFISCRGTGSPTLVFLVGTDWPSNQMGSIEDRFVGDVRVCHYDRAGEGQSDPPDTPASVETVVEDLAALLDAAAVPPPYVLVGQSVGGDQAWLFADRHPEGVAGLLLMNAGFFELDWDELDGALTDDEIAGEREYSEQNLGPVLQAATPPDDIAYTVMMSTDAQCETPGDVCHRIYPFFEAWGEELAGRTPNGRLVSVEAGHEIWPSEPEIVDAEIQRLIDLAR